MMNISKLLQRSVVVPLRPLSTSPEEKIEIPRRIPRGPTDILRALESTVGRDPTAAHYKYHDDPYLVPMSNSGKRTFALAQEAGRKAAHWVRSQHPDLFQHKEADPLIEAFVPPMIYNENTEVTIEDLEKTVEMAQAKDAVLVYRLLKAKGDDVPGELKQGLLELLCYQNCEDVIFDEFVEERWFTQSNRAKEKMRNVWKNDNFAEELFSSMENKTTEAYAALIQGMAKHQQADRAWQLFEEARQKGLPLNTNTFNSVITITNFLKESFDLRWELVKSLLLQMKETNLKPNLGTLNSVLQVLSGMGNAKLAKQYALSTLAEFKKIGIEPCLASWFYILLTFCKERGPVSTVLNDIMNVIEDKEHTIQSLKDTSFFVTAMEMCRNHLRDVNLARRVDKLLYFGNNYNLIGDSYKESVYFRHYFALFCDSLPLEEFMKEVYFILVPHIYVPEPGIMTKVLEQIDLNGGVEYIPKMWSDMVMFDYQYRENLVELVMNSMHNNKQVASEELREQFAKIAWDIYSRIEDQDQNKMVKMNFTGDLLGKILTVLLQNEQFEKACSVMEKLDKDQHKIAGVPSIESLSLFVDRCIEQKSPSRGINCIHYISDCGFPEAKSLAKKLHERLNLGDEFLRRLTTIVGDLNL